MAKEVFTADFNAYACIGDTIESPALLGGFRTGLRLVATIYEDDDKTPPPDRQDGYWPSLDPNDNGYIGPKSQATLKRETAKAQAVLDAWKRDEWCYVGIAVQAWFDDVPLTDEYSHAVWGVEMNYPDKRRKNTNTYLRELANENAQDCAREAIRALTAIVEESADG